MALRFLQAPLQGGQQMVYLFVDHQPVFAGYLNAQTIKNVKRVNLAKGVHHLEILARDQIVQSKFILGYETDDGTFKPLPKAWFSADECPQIAAFLKPKATLAVDGDALVGTLTGQPPRSRKLRLVFNDFSGSAVTVKSVTIKDDRGQAIVPVQEDFSSGKKTQALQIAPGDRIHLVYEERAGHRRAEVVDGGAQRRLLQRLDPAGQRADHRPARGRAAPHLLPRPALPAGRPAHDHHRRP